MAAPMTKREAVKLMIEEGIRTKAQIAEDLEMSVASLSTQMTYLRWMNNYYIYDDNRIVKSVTAEEFAAWQAEQKLSKKVKMAPTPKSPQKLFEVAERTYARTKALLLNWETKLKTNTADTVTDFEEFTAEAQANITLCNIKMNRATVIMDNLLLEINAPASANPDEAVDAENDEEDELI